MSRASIERVDEDRIRKVAAENPDVLRVRLAQRFGISVARLSKILGVGKNYGELLNPKMIKRYTPRPGALPAGRHANNRFQDKLEHVRKQLRAQENEARTSWNSDFKPMRRPNGRGGP